MIRKIRCIFHAGLHVYAENHDTKTTFCFLNRETKANLFFAVTVKKSFNMRMHNFAVAVLTQYPFFLYKLKSVSFLIHFSNIFFLSLCIYILKIVLQSLNIVLNLFIMKNHIVAPHVLY